MRPGCFETDAGRPVTAVTATEMRRVDDVATDDLSLSLLQMMENAGRTLATHVMAETDGPVLVLAGNGGNGGGSITAARHLANHDRDVTVHLDRPADELTGAAAHQHRILEHLDVPIYADETADDHGDPAVVVDAIIGYGLSGEVRGPARTLIETTDALDAHVVSLDVPSGRDATDGTVHGIAVAPDHVLTLALPKTGLRAVDCPVTLADISIPGWVYQQLDIPYDPPFGDAYTVSLFP